MTRAELLARTSSQELSGWMVLFQIQAEETQHQRDVIESGDGVVYTSGLDDDDEDEEDTI